MLMLEQQRDVLQVPDDVCYLNTSYMGPQLRTVVDAGKAAIDWRSRPWEITAADFFDTVEEVRAGFADLIGATRECIALVPAASYGIATAAAVLPFDHGESILLLESEYPSNFYSWQRLASERGGNVIQVPRPADGNWTNAVLARLDGSVRIASLPHCYWVDGSCLDLVAIGEAMRFAGAALVLDLTQSCGAMPIDVGEVDPDFAVVAGYKWLLCPYGSGFLYVAPRHHDARPLEENWAGRVGAENFSQLVPYKDAYQPGARRYDVGERSNFTAVAQCRAALRQLAEWRVENIADTLRVITGELADRCADTGLTADTRSLAAPHIFGLPLPASAPEDLLARLAHDGVYASIRGRWLRLSPHLHVNCADLDRFADSLTKHLRSSC
ncbi:MAG: aminotransferase class V-fold PLP-dependent enzyme [Pseudomonadota bacterium]|nr:aminotransferase class V-fold PLP-dependent enzyme [Pseudomonadota bacterium]